ncbi:hypothetical protein F4780DRAFT_775401 [Xylariomycetidae sp. FL0641]|nr:hypothetical protein F4780DRAFT_775401 [Xylariomycetidae sp. FL0641]
MATHELASTVQSAHVKRHPSPTHDANPSTAASARHPVDPDDEDDDDVDSEIPLSVLRPRPRKHSFPPMPDLRFEQSYLHSLRGAEGRWGVVAWVTVRDQVLMPFAQGVLYNLALCGWQHWNRNAQMSGNSAGARLRRWWYGVNNWPLPGEPQQRKAKAA